MLRVTLPAATALVLLLAAMPLAEARHAGPCWHEYADAALEYLFVHGSFQQTFSTWGACLDGTVWYVCHGNPWITCRLA